MYKWITTDKVVKRLSDEAFIPVSEDNKDWLIVLEFIKSGGVIEPEDKPIVIDTTPSQLDILTKIVLATAPDSSDKQQLQAIVSGTDRISS